MHHHKIMPDHQADQCGIAHCTLPLDALRRVLSLLDWYVIPHPPWQAAIRQQQLKF